MYQIMFVIYVYMWVRYGICAIRNLIPIQLEQIYDTMCPQ